MSTWLPDSLLINFVFIIQEVCRLWRCEDNSGIGNAMRYLINFNPKNSFWKSFTLLHVFASYTCTMWSNPWISTSTLQADEQEGLYAFTGATKCMSAGLNFTHHIEHLAGYFCIRSMIFGLPLKWWYKSHIWVPTLCK